MKRECSAVGKTQRALWSWLIRRSRWSQAVSSRSSSATSSSGSPATADSARRQALGQLDVAVDRVADEVDRGERVARHGVHARSAPAARRCVAATSSRSAAGARATSTSSPQDRIQRRISIVPDTVARQRSEPSASVSTVWVGCQVASRTRAATAGAKRSTTSTGGWSAMMSQAARSAEVVAAGSGGSNVRGVSAAVRIRSILNVRSAPRSSSKPIRYSAWVWSDGSRRYGRTVARRGAAPPS